MCFSKKLNGFSNLNFGALACARIDVHLSAEIGGHLARSVHAIMAWRCNTIICNMASRVRGYDDNDTDNILST